MYWVAKWLLQGFARIIARNCMHAFAVVVEQIGRRPTGDDPEAIRAQCAKGQVPEPVPWPFTSDKATGTK